ncbi:MAG: hypothetical protein J3R72DRAFT_426997 [Linnemannia gamsii]|nr:MAG: hypothetical protein J3R72DRAFT_426997 [Linnemannia gamsii]
MALKALLSWRKEVHESWVSSRPNWMGRETWILPDNAAKLLSQKFSEARTATEVAAIASSCYWGPLEKNLFAEIAQVLDELNNKIDARRGSGSQTTAASVPDKSKDGSDGDGERSDNDGFGSDGEENSPEP